MRYNYLKNLIFVGAILGCGFQTQIQSQNKKEIKKIENPQNHLPKNKMIKMKSKKKNCFIKLKLVFSILKKVEKCFEKASVL